MPIVKCKKIQNEETKINYIVSIGNKFFKSMLILGVISILVFVKRSMKNDVSIGKLLGYLLLSSIGMVCIYIADSYAYNNLIVGLGACIGFELLKF